MKRFIFAIGFILGFWLTVPFSSSAEDLGDARLSLIQGGVLIQNMDTGAEWGAASINMPLTQGTKVWVPQRGRLEIQFLGGSYLRADENTDVDVTELESDSQSNIIQVAVPEGRTYINYAGSAADNSVFQVDTALLSVKAYGPAKFKVDVSEDGYSEVSVVSGAVYVETQNGSTKVDAGGMLSITNNQIAELSPMRAADSWDRWNQSRDSALARSGISREYLPPALDVYSNDFDTYGRWVSTSDYGYVWTPRVMVADWSPYRIGRWCWIRGDYVWVSYEPWGWVPYHYGRWAFLSQHGWCWVPPRRSAVYWSPGFVAWVHTPYYVAWVPLAPREIYYGHGYYGPHSVNVKDVDINKINITNVYVNAKVANSVTVINRETFLTGKPVRGDIPKNPFTAGAKVSIGRPDLRPVKETSLPRPEKIIAQKDLPSRDIVTRAKKIENRPVARDKDISVFKPGKRASSMRVDRIDRPRPITQVQKPELRQPPAQRGEMRKTPARGRETAPPPAEREGPRGPSTQREFGIAPPQKEERSVPSPRREEMGTPPVQRREVGPPPERREMNKPSGPSKALPQTEPPQSIIREREQRSAPPQQRREVAPPSVKREEKREPSSQREMGIAPSYREKSKDEPPVRRERKGRR
ncbi:MAG: DUF6600 domain-containing protein [Thermodesulfobacteriota bacterium]